MTMPTAFISMDTARKESGLGRDFLYEAIRSGKLPAANVSCATASRATYKIRRCDLMKFMEQLVRG